jgi:diadenosine tetraphosphate (Ap4A) HIT family hydrolase
VASACEICERIARFNDDNPYVIAELETGYAVLADNQYYRGYTIFLSKRCVPELHDLPPDVRLQFLQEMSLVAEAVFRAFKPRKLNYELLGNSVAHLHWHIVPRYADDPNPQWPIWSNQAFVDAPRRTNIEPAELASMRERVQRELTANRPTS